MPDNNNTTCATDKEIFDLLMSSKLKLTELVLRNIARNRGIFYSPRTDRFGLVDSLATLIHDHYDILEIIERRDPSRRAEKTTAVDLPGNITVEDIKEALKSYQNETQGSENVNFYSPGSTSLKMDV